MEPFSVNDDFSMDVFARGRTLLQEPLLNKGAAFVDEERTALRLHGLLPTRWLTLEEQVAQCYAAFSKRSSDLEKHVYLRRDRKSVV